MSGFITAATVAYVMQVLARKAEIDGIKAIPPRPGRPLIARPGAADIISENPDYGCKMLKPL
jgi:hypothetical protein